MSGLLEVVALDAADAERAEAGGADRVAVYGELDDGGLSPTPKLVAEVRRATSVQVRVMVRLRDGYSTDGGEAVRLRGLMASYAEAGADGMILGFLNGLGEVDVALIEELIDGGTWPWTFHRAIDATLDADRAWLALRRVSRLDQVLTAGSARDVESGLGELLDRAKADPWAAGLIMAGGGLRAEHVPWLTRVGVHAFHVGSAARPGGSYREGVDEALVRSWRSLISQESRHRPSD
jgi:Uncharacterized protein involved in copper resistance